MPLTEFQKNLAQTLSINRSEDSHLAGGAAINFSPNSIRYSNDLDYFHDSEERVASAFSADQNLLKKNGYKVSVEMHQPGYIRAIVQKDTQSTKVEWSHDSAWRFMPTVFEEDIGYTLHPIDLAINKVLALAGRDEPRDYIDIHQIFDNTLPLGPLVWAAVGKDPGFTPHSLLELLKRRGKYRPDEFSRLNLRVPVDVMSLKEKWLSQLNDAEEFFLSRQPEDLGALYYSKNKKSFVDPRTERHENDVVLHYGRLGGVLPVVVNI